MTAVVAGDPVASVSCGVPVTVTASLNVTVTGTTWPARYLPLGSGEETPLTVGWVVSMTRFFVAPSDPAAPGAARVRVALRATTSRMVPPLSASEFVAE